MNLDGNFPSYEQQEAIKTAVEGVKTVVNTVDNRTNTTNTNVGSNSDTSSATGSVHAKLKDIKASVGATTDAANATGSVHAKLRDIKANLGVKSLQRGTVTGVAVGASSGASIPVSSVNPLKSDIKVYGDATMGTGGGDPYVVSFDGTTLILKANSYNGGTLVSWQIVEYY